MSTIKQAVILAGGLGARLRPLTLTTPKPMININGVPFLEYIIRLLKKNNIERVLILTGYLHEKVESYFKNGSDFGISIDYLYSPVEDDTATRVKKALGLLDKEFLLLYSDNYWPLNLRSLVKFYRSKKALGSVVIYSNTDNYSKNNIKVNSKGLVEKYVKNSRSNDLNGVDIGFFILKRSVIHALPNDNCSLENTVFPYLIINRQLAGYRTDHKYYGLSTPQRIPMIEKYFTPKKVVLLDRDGVINHKPPKAEYIQYWKDFRYLPNVIKALHELSAKGYQIYIISNQAGIGRGIITRSQVEIIHMRLVSDLSTKGITINGIYICGHGWNDGCTCRKPEPGLLFRAASDHLFDLTQSYCIGDDMRDIAAGKKAGCKTFLVTNKNSLYDIVHKHL